VVPVSRPCGRLARHKSNYDNSRISDCFVGIPEVVFVPLIELKHSINKSEQNAYQLIEASTPFHFTGVVPVSRPCGRLARHKSDCDNSGIPNHSVGIPEVVFVPLIELKHFYQRIGTKRVSTYRSEYTLSFHGSGAGFKTVWSPCPSQEQLR